MTIVNPKLFCLFKSYLSAFVVCCLFQGAQAQTEEVNNVKIYLGAYDNRVPFSFLDKKHQPQGILIKNTLRLCRKAKMSCEFVIGKFEKLLADVQTFQLDGLVVIDALVLPNIDRLNLTSPICKLSPVFIQKKAATLRSKPEDFKESTIGVLQDSLMHLHLVEKYTSNANLKPYLVLESGIVDLITGRIDALAADDAFFQVRVANTILGKADAISQLVATKATDAELPASSMAIAMRTRDKALLDKLEKALQDNDELKDCTLLLNDRHNAKPNERPPQ